MKQNIHKSNLIDQYKSPLWQKKRLEALSFYDFTCQRCFSESETLHVHHRQYFSGRNIWDYDNCELECLCNQCHDETHKDIDDLKKVLCFIPSDSIVDITALLIGFIDVKSGHITEAKKYLQKDKYINTKEFIAGNIAAKYLDSKL